MRKILSLLATTILSTTATTSVIACDGGGVQSIIQKNDLDTIPNSLILNGISKYIKKDFYIKLIDEIKKIKPEFKELKKSDIKISKTNGSELQYNEIINNPKLEILLRASPNNKNFTGHKNIEINLTVTETDLSFLPEKLYITGVNSNSIRSFEVKLFSEIEKQEGFAAFDHQADIYRKDTSNNLQPNDIVDNPNLEVTVIEKNTSNNFKGQKDIKVDLTVL